MAKSLQSPSKLGAVKVGAASTPVEANGIAINHSEGLV